MMRKVPESFTPAFLDLETERFLSFQEVVNAFKPLSLFGKKEFLHIKPLEDDKVKQAYEFMKKIEKCQQRERIEHILSDFHEISSSLNAVERGNSTVIDLFEIKRFIHHHRILKEMTQNCLDGYFSSLEDVWKLLDPQKSASYAFSPFNAEIERLTKECLNLQSKIKILYQKVAKKLEEKYNVKVKDGKFVLPRRKAKELLLSSLIMVEREGIQSYTFALRPTDEILKLEKKLLDCEEKLKNSQNDEIKRLSIMISHNVERLKAERRKIAEFDLSLAKLRGLKWGWTYPTFSSSIEMKSAFHPQVKKKVEEMGYEYTNLDGTFERGLTMIFGPNMGGKTTTLKTIGLLCALASYGFLVPAKSAVLPKVKWIRYIGSQEENDGLSKFARQIDLTARSLSLPQNGLILIDEFGAGTNPYEGEALASALATSLAKRKDFSVMVTHYRKTIENVECKKYTLGRLNFEGGITIENLFSKIDHHLVNGAHVKLGDAIKLAEILGLPCDIIENASKNLLSFSDERSSN